MIYEGFLKKIEICQNYFFSCSLKYAVNQIIMHKVVADALFIRIRRPLVTFDLEEVPCIFLNLPAYIHFVNIIIFF